MMIMCASDGDVNNFVYKLSNILSPYYSVHGIVLADKKGEVFLMLNHYRETFKRLSSGSFGLFIVQPIRPS